MTYAPYPTPAQHTHHTPSQPADTSPAVHFDRCRRIVRRRDGAGRVLDYSYDAGGRLERVMADGELLARVERDFAARTMSAHGPGSPKTISAA